MRSIIINMMNNKNIFITLSKLEHIFQKTKNYLSQQIPNNYIALKIAMKANGYINIELAKKIENQKLGKIIRNCLYIGDSSLKNINSYIDKISILIKNYSTKKWNNELLDITDNNQKTIGYIERSTARALGLKTRVVHLNAWNSNTSIWISKRSNKKAINPGKWDTLVGGLVSYKENINQALKRESLEEANLDISAIRQRSKLQKIIDIYKLTSDGFQTEELFSSSCLLNNMTPSNKDGEIDIIKIHSIEEVIRLIERNDFTEESSLIIIKDLIQKIKMGLNLHQE
ncbi:NUDIX domain-containing protein [Candidatus Kinetoplastidibacterium crithidiae]|uniref:NUDIX domain-containing protein n=1 Tax=Candidatus Kinetoplastidibacterium crithidiae TaxID=33056 RepID=UPI000684B8D9|nr:NUDIX domain-containing protein [Candidatus Kinetoplastibacterium crithidii]